MGLIVVVPPSVEPVTLAEVKLYLRVEHDDDDVLITELIRTAREQVEAYTCRSLITQTLELRLEGYQDDTFATQLRRGELRLPRPPVRSIVSFQYVDPSGMLLAMPPTTYETAFDQEPAVMRAVHGSYWPTLGYTYGTVQVRYVAGYGANGSAVPSSLRLAIMFLLSHYYENRGPEMTGVSIATFNRTEENLMNPYRVLEV